MKPKLKSTWDEFTNLYSLQKTLRFELKPVGKTLENIENKKLISNDEKRAESYKKMKRTIDGFHRHFIELAMLQVQLTHLKEFTEMYRASAEEKKEEGYKKKLEEIQTKLRKEIARGFQTGEAKTIYSKLFKKELITELLEEWIKTQDGEDIYFDEEFKTFTTYFGGFHENRKNMYTDENKSTAIAYRLVHENLPKFLDNINTFEKIKSVPELYEKCESLFKEIKGHLDISSINEAFELKYYNELLTQKKIDSYNLIIGGKTSEEGRKKIQGMNEYINLHNQKQEKKNRVPKLKQLYKQILSDRESISFLPEQFEDDADSTASQKVLDAIEEYYKANLTDFKLDGKEETENVLKNIKEMLEQLKDYDLSKIHIRNDKATTNISKALFGDWSIIKTALEFTYTRTLKIGKKGLSKKQEDNRERYLKQPYFSIAEIEKALFEYKNENEALRDLQENPVADYFHTHLKAEKKEDSDKELDLIANIEAKYSCIKGILNTDYPKDKRLHQDKKTIDDVKAFLDSLREFLHFVKPLALPKDSVLEKDENFYSYFDVWYDELQKLTTLYNKVRNYATQKPYSTENFKLNFENDTLLKGWDVNKEEDNTAILFEKEGDHFLGVMDKEHNKILRDIPTPKSNDQFRKINYKLLPGASKMLPKVFFSAKNIDFYDPSEEILRIRNCGSHTKNGSPQSGFEKSDFNLSDCRKMVSFFKDSIQRHPDWKNFGFRFSPTDTYTSIDEFYREVEQQGYSISYMNIDKDKIMEWVDQGKLYLFQIYNKDFSKYSKGKPNLHTLFWKALFDPENLKDVVYKLNGEAEMFYRRKSIQNENKVVHKANKPISNKNPNAKKKDGTFEYDIIKDRRYTVDKFQFHAPITLNFKASGNGYINTNVLDYLKNNSDVNIIGIDRGERHLIYLTLIDRQGNIKEQYSLNEITNKYKDIEYKTNYHQLLDKKEEERDKARKDWGTIETIKELKEGYISQVIHKIAKMMVKHNAIVVMEDLNFGFKRYRFKVEKQVYQKLERKLIEKLNYLVFKDKEDNGTCGIYHALQLTNKFESFKKLGKQSGFLFYVPAWMTSKIDPTTGFVNLFNTKFENVEKTKTFFSNFENIQYNSDKDYFEFEVKKYSLFNSKADDTKQDWIICTRGDRIITFRNPGKNNQRDNKEIALSDEFKGLFKEYGINYETDLKRKILSQTEKTFFKELLNFFKYTLQMRNSIIGSEEDYLISPVMNSEGKFYDSREEGSELSKNADANGAYNIARKGLWVLEQINSYGEDDWKKLNLAISNKEWLQFAQSKQ